MPKMKDELVIDDELSSFLPPQVPEELAELEQSLLAHGCLDPIKAQEGTNLVLDGHTRLKLCKKHDIPYTVDYVSVPGGREGALDWMIKFQFGRRNLTDDQKSLLRGREYLLRKKPAGRPTKKDDEPSKNGDDKAKGDKDDDGTFSLADAEGSMLEAVAQKHGVSRATIVRDAEFAEAFDNLKKAEQTEFISGAGPSKSELIAKFRDVKPKKRLAKKKPGAAKFNWTNFTTLYEKLVRATDEIATAHDSKKSNEHRSSLKLLADFKEKIDEWKARLDAKKEE